MVVGRRSLVIGVLVLSMGQAFALFAGSLLQHEDYPVRGEAEFYGVKLLFRKFDSRIQNRTHSKQRTKLLYRSQRLRADVVVPLDSKKISEKKYLEKLCFDYSKIDFVFACVPNLVPKLASCDDCLVRHKLAAPGPRLAPPEPLLHTLEKMGRRPWPGTSNSWDIASVLGNKRLTGLWGQEAAGFPETRELLSSHKNVRLVRVGVLDSEFNGNPRAYNLQQLSVELKECLQSNPKECGAEGGRGSHGTKALNLIAGKDPIGGAPTARIERIVANDGKTGYTQGVDAMLGYEKDDPPEVVSLSMGLPTPGFVKSYTQGRIQNGDIIMRSNFEVLSSKSLLVVAAGNSYPDLS